MSGGEAMRGIQKPRVGPASHVEGGALRGFRSPGFLLRRSQERLAPFSPVGLEWG